jgi:cytosine/adenosine deaminase-related metal-dependent hydrolase
MIQLSAGWILPMSDVPIVGGFVVVEGDRVVSVGRTPDGGAIGLGRVALLPGLVNAHTHLELSYLRGAIDPSARFVDWVRPMLAARRALVDRAAPAVLTAARRAIEEARAAGTVLVGDVANSLETVPLLREAGMRAHVFHELIGFSPGDADALVAEARRAVDSGAASDDDVRVSLAPHAPYSVSPELFAAIRRDLNARPHTISTVHLGESSAEVELLTSGTGDWRDLLEDLGVWRDTWRVPGVSPVEYLLSLGFLDRSVLVVHGVLFENADLDRLRAMGATIVSCPRSNRHVGVGSPPLDAFYARGIDVAFGTDSLASVEDLNVFAELAEARRIAPRVGARALLRSATVVGARALGFGADYGSIEPGKRAALIAVRVPEGVSDVEEYLVSGIAPDAVTQIDAPFVRGLHA